MPDAKIGPSKELTVQGLTLVIPQDWKVEPFQPNEMSGTVAAYRLPKVSPDAEDAIMKISHFPGMKGKDDDNINRWLSQVMVDGKPITREEAEFHVEEKGNVRITTINAKGAISTSMMGGGKPMEGQQMIAAIIDHPQGPHFVKISGGENTLEKHREMVLQVINSATVK